MPRAILVRLPGIPWLALLADWTVALGSSFTAAGFCMQYWFPQVPVWVWCVVFCAIIFGLNVISTRFFAEGEFWFSLVKVVTIIAFIILGGAAIFGFIPMQDGSPAPGLSNITAEGWFPHGGLPILMTMVAVNFAFRVPSLSALPPVKRKTRAKLSR